jgi:hypothetical protein
MTRLLWNPKVLYHAHNSPSVVPILSQMHPLHAFPLYFPRIGSNISHDSSVGIALGYGLDDRGSRVRIPAGSGNFLFTTASRMALGPTQPPIQWVPGSLSLGVRRPGREADHSLPSSTEVKNEWIYNSSPQIRLHGVILS